MRHALWLMPLILGIILMAWCIYHPINHHHTFGREWLAGTTIILSLFIKLFMTLEAKRKGHN